ncbi:hypothetical protein G6F49_009043 [Rhizopus delemar]|nr:hypothetical protein G6F49_009043 [Rhizopus delemar]KAG1585392.1 hypothetical protein G6F48_007297 [Rhizopus delemar]
MTDNIINSRQSMIDSLNQIMDTSHVLSEAELQNELDIFANVQFTFDDEPNCHKSEIVDYKRPSVQHDIRSLLNIKLASLVDPHDPTILSSDAISRFYDNSPTCTPPNGYYSPNISPPNGFDSPNPTPPNGLLPEHAHDLFQAIINPPIPIYDEEPRGQEEEGWIGPEEPKKKSSLSKEDKRRRNTAASARFRVKKKMREQALQQTATEMTEKARAFEIRVHELEREHVNDERQVGEVTVMRPVKMPFETKTQLRTDAE